MNAESISSCPPTPTLESEQALVHQLTLYARDLRLMLTRERQQAASLAAANARLGRLDRLKLDFISLISHELRTPLTSMALVGLLDTSELEPSQAEVVQLITAGYTRLERFASRAVDYFQVLADLDAQGDALTDFGEVARSRMQDLSTKARVEAELGEAKYPVGASPSILTRVIDTLFENAVKHSVGPAHIAVRLVRTPLAFQFIVRDHGKGFAPEMATEIVRAMTPADIMHHSDGLGLSLSLATQIVESLGGRLSAASEGPGTGATFTVELPVETASRAVLPVELA